MVVSGDVVHVVWNGDAGYQGRYYRRSDDGGLTWSDRFTLPLPKTSGGLQGAPAIIADSSQTVHIIYSDSPHLYYIRMRNGVWSSPELVAGPETVGSKNEIDTPMLGITNGNILHALYTRDAQAVYYQRRTINAPVAGAVPWPSTSTATPKQTVAAAMTPSTMPEQVSEEPTRTAVPISQAASPVDSSASPVLAGLIGSGMVTALVVAAVRLRAQRH
jgi:hypothetical protein